MSTLEIILILFILFIVIFISFSIIPWISRQLSFSSKFSDTPISIVLFTLLQAVFWTLDSFLSIEAGIATILTFISIVFWLPKFFLKLLGINEKWASFGFSTLVLASVIIFSSIMYTTENLGFLPEETTATMPRPPGPEIDFSGMEGKLIYSFPDTIQLYSTSTVQVRMAPEFIDDSMLMKQFHYYKDSITADYIPLSNIMKVDLKEISYPRKTKIQRINNSSEQQITSKGFREWVFSVYAEDIGDVRLAVSVSQVKWLDEHLNYLDIPIYREEVNIYATSAQKLKRFWNNNYLAVVSIGLGLIMLSINKIIPNNTKITYAMAVHKETDFWNAGSLGLAIYLITIMSIVFFKMFEINLYFVPLVFAGTILIYATFTAVTLRDSDKISEENFVKLMGMAIMKIPPMSWFASKKE